MEQNLAGKKVAIIVTDGFEESEFTKPLEALRKAGASIEVLSIRSGKVKAWSKNDWGEEYTVDKTVADAEASDYDAMVLPGGVMNPDKLRMDKDVVAFATAMMRDRKPVAAICHGPWTLIETGLIAGRNVTSYPSLRSDLENAGANWSDEEVVVDKGLVTSRKPDDLPAFCKKMVEEIAEGIHAR